MIWVAVANLALAVAGAIFLLPSKNWPGFWWALTAACGWLSVILSEIKA